MYEYQGLSDAFFLMLYGAAAWFALLACVYLLWRVETLQELKEN